MENQTLDMAGRWYAEQAERLGVTAGELKAAILRGWGGHEVAALPIARAGLYFRA